MTVFPGQLCTHTVQFLWGNGKNSYSGTDIACCNSQTLSTICLFGHPPASHSNDSFRNIRSCDELSAIGLLCFDKKNDFCLKEKILKIL